MTTEYCGALSDVKVVDFSRVGAGPQAAKYLADFGATVIKVESSDHPDFSRVSTPFKDGVPGLDKSGLFVGYNSSKYSVTLDIANPKGKEIAKKLAAWADVVVESFRPGLMEEFGLGYQELSQVNQSIIMVSCSILGRQGPAGHVAGFGFTAAGLTGYYHLTGYEEGEPVSPLSIAYADEVQYPFITLAILAAIDHRDRTGRGQHLDIGQLEPMTLFLAPALLDYEVNGCSPRRVGNRHPDACPHNTFRCKGDDRWCAIAVFTEEEWAGLCRAMGREDIVGLPEYRSVEERKESEDELEQLVTAWTMHYSPDEIMGMLQREKVPAGKVQNGAEVRLCPHLRERKQYSSLERGHLGTFLHVSPPARLSDTPARPRIAPLLGEHNELVCSKILHLPDEEFAELVGAGVFG